ncbi:MAG TPA: TonB-dependent receptor [Terracidiphilus sp.]|jgi:hypothetical protein
MNHDQPDIQKPNHGSLVHAQSIRTAEALSVELAKGEGARKPNMRTALAILCAILTIFSCSRLHAQAGIDQGSVTGTIKDPTGALVAGARCTLTNTATGVSQEAVSTSAGAYTFPLVSLGIYTLKVEAKGFEDYVVTGISIHIGATDTDDVTLRVGAASSSVTVTSSAPLLQAQNASLGMSVDSKMANDLPIFGGSGGRSFMELATLAAGVQFTGSPNNTGTFLVHGTESGQVDVRLNGADDNAEVFGGITIPPIPDAIQEFSIQTGDNGASLGHSYGAVVNVTTKTGTNKFQGSVWEYDENDMFNANDYFTKLHELVTGSPLLPNRPGRYKENSFGGIFGGPVLLPHYNGHNKTFFTVDYQHTLYTNTSNFTGTVPTTLMQSSDFSNMSDTLTLSNQAATASPQVSEKQDALGRWFQIGMMLDPATTRAVPCGSVDSVTGLATNCKVGYAPTINGKQYAIVRDPFISGAGCPSLAGTVYFNSTYNKANGSQPTYAPSCFNQLPAGRLDANAVALLKLFPGANQPAHYYGSNYFAILPQTIDTQQYDVRIDHTISATDSLFGTFSHYNSINHPSPPFPGVIEGGSNVSFWTTNPTYMVVLTETHVFNPNLINQFRASEEHNWNTRTDPGSIDTTYGTPAQYGIQGIPQTTDNGGLPTFTVDSGISSFGSRANVTWQKVGSWQFSDDLTKIAGRHELKFGAELNLTYGDIVQISSGKGSFTYNGQYSDTPNSGDTDTGLADFLLAPGSNVASSSYAAAGGLSTATNLIGGASAFIGNNWTKSTYHAPYVALYAVDTWKLRPNLTANLGLRYEHFAPYSSNGGQEANFWMGGADGNQPGGSGYFIAHGGCNTPMSSFFTGLLAYNNIPIVCEPNNTANDMPIANWAPRLGIAYRIRPNLVARVGGGIAYGAFGSVGYGGTLGTNYPFTFNVKSGSASNAYTPQLIGTGNNVSATMENTFGTIDLDNPLAASLPLGSFTLYGKQYHYKVPNVMTLDFALEWQFTNNDAVTGRYVGNLGKHLDTLGPYHNSPRELLTTNTSAVSACTSAQLASNPYCENTPAMANGDGNVVPFPNLALNTLMDPTNQISNYQSGEAEYQHRFAEDFNMDANYTYARCWSDAQGGENNSGGPGNGRAPMVIGFGGYRSDYDRCTNLATHIFRLWGEYDVPLGQGARWLAHSNGWEDAIVGGWKFDPIWIASTGTLNNITCQGTNGYGANPTFTGPWFQANSTNFNCYAPTVPGEHLYGPGPKDKPRTKVNGYWNSSAFTAPEEAVQSNGQLDFSPLGVRGNQIYGPGFYNVSAAVHKSFKTTESTRLEIEGEAINAFNHMQPSNPSVTNYTTPTSESLTGGWGTVTSTRSNNGAGRIWQFAGKFYF